MPTNPKELEELANEYEKRAHRIGMLLSDPPQWRPEARILLDVASDLRALARDHIGGDR